MEKLNAYREIARQVLLGHAKPAELAYPPSVEEIVVLDEERGNYQILRWGWDQSKRAKWMIVYFRLKNEKFWIEQDMTEKGIANELLDAGVPREDIVLAFHEPEMRPLTEFAIA